MRELFQAIPDADVVLALEPEELGAKLLFLVRQAVGDGNFHPGNYMNALFGQINQEGYPYDDILADKRLLNLKDLSSELVSQYPFPSDDLVSIESVRERVIKLADNCWKNGTITTEAEHFIEAYDHSQDKLYNETFG